MSGVRGAVWCDSGSGLPVNRARLQLGGSVRRLAWRRGPDLWVTHCRYEHAGQLILSDRDPAGSPPVVQVRA